MCSNQCCEGKCGGNAAGDGKSLVDFMGSVVKRREYAPSFMCIPEDDDDTRKYSMWSVPPEAHALDYDMQCALGAGFASQLLDMYVIDDHRFTMDNQLPAIVSAATGAKLDGVMVGFFSELASYLVSYAKATRSLD